MLIYPKVVVQPVVEPITATGDVFLQSRITDTAEVPFVDLLIKAARQFLEKRLSRALVEQTLEWYLDYWPSLNCAIDLPWARPLLTVVSGTYKDSNAVVTTMVEGTDYVVDLHSDPGRVMPLWGELWPSFTPFSTGSVTWRYTAGDNGASLSPAVAFADEQVKHALRLLCGHFYDHREAVIVGENVTIESRAMELAFEALCGQLELPGTF